MTSRPRNPTAVIVQVSFSGSVIRLPSRFDPRRSVGGLLLRQRRLDMETTILQAREGIV